jgi:hypothetical protein
LIEKKQQHIHTTGKRSVGQLCLAPPENESPEESCRVAKASDRLEDIELASRFQNQSTPKAPRDSVSAMIMSVSSPMNCDQASLSHAARLNQALIDELSQKRAALASLKIEQALLSEYAEAEQSKHQLTAKLNARRESLAALSNQREALRLCLKWLHAT